MRIYDVAIASLAIDAPQKWTDNLISHHPVQNVIAERRGVARKIPHQALIRLALIRMLNKDVHLGVRDAVHLAERLWEEGGNGHLEIGALRLSVDKESLTRIVEQRLRDALESAPTPRRGRPIRRQARVDVT